MHLFFWQLILYSQPESKLNTLAETLKPRTFNSQTFISLIYAVGKENFQDAFKYVSTLFDL